MSALPKSDLDYVLAHGRIDWESFRAQRIFLTGGTGFFGSWLVETFLHANRERSLGSSLTILSRAPAAFMERRPHLSGVSGIDFVAGDIRDFVFPAGRFDVVIHAATEASQKLNSESPLVMLDTVVAGTRRALDFAVASRAGRFLLTSSGAVYGSQPSQMTHVPEEYAGGPNPLDPNSAYGEGKRLAEHICGVYARQHGLTVLIARCFAFVGPHLPLDAHFAIGNFMRDALQGGPIRVGGDGTPHRSYLYAADLAAWLWTILGRGTSLRPYNVGSDASVSIHDLARQICDIALLPGEVQIAQPPSGKPPARYVPAIDRARAELGLEVEVDLHAAITRTLDWHRANRY